MIKPFSLSILLLCLILAESQIININTTPTLITNLDRLVISTTQDADVYRGNVQINIPGGNTSRIEFFGTLVKNTVNCAYSRCFSGWINNYTMDGVAVVGFGNQTLAIQPVFQFKTNSQTDYVIIRNPKLAQTWVQIIQILCQKINPQIASTTTSATQKLSVPVNLAVQSTKTTTFSATIATDPATQSTAIPPESEAIIPKYSFQTVLESDLKNAQTLKVNTLTFGSNIFDIGSLGLAAGDRVATLTQPVNLAGFKAPTSSLSQNLVLNSQNLVKRRALTYNLKLLTDLQSTATGQKAPDFSGIINLNFNLVSRTKVPLENVRSVSSLLADAANKQTYNSENIQQRRTTTQNSIFQPLQRTVQVFPKAEESDILVGTNQKLLSFNVVDQLNKISQADSILNTINFEKSVETQITIDPSTLSLRTGSRLLQVLQNYTIYNYKKVLFSKTIFGKSFETNVEVKCNLLVLSNDHQVQCTGKLNYILFGSTKSVQIFNFIKSIHLSWTFSKTFSGSWPFSVYIPLPPPVSFMGINFNFQISFQIKINIAVTTTGADPLVYKCYALATTSVNTVASAALRVIAIEGGVYISGTLVSAGTDPTITLSYYIKQKYIKVLAQWYFWIQAFKYEWGFFYRYWTFWSGWSSQKKIASWTINGVYGKWAIVNKSWNIYL